MAYLKCFLLQEAYPDYSSGTRRSPCQVLSSAYFCFVAFMAWFYLFSCLFSALPHPQPASLWTPWCKNHIGSIQCCVVRAWNQVWGVVGRRGRGGEEQREEGRKERQDSRFMSGDLSLKPSSDRAVGQPRGSHHPSLWMLPPPAPSGDRLLGEEGSACANPTMHGADL